MNKDYRKLEQLLGNKRLQPRNAFQRQLRTKLHIRRRWTPSASAKWSLAIAPLLIVTVLALSIYQPSNIGQTTGLSALYGKALAAQKLETENTTFWQSERSQTFGPAAQTCTNLSAEQQAAASTPQTILLFKDGQTSAFLIAENKQALAQRYSSDPEVEAVDPESFTGEKDFSFTSILKSATLVDREGNPLPEDAKVPTKTTGTYDLYARHSAKAGTKYGLPGCQELFVHTTIDSNTQTFRSISVYKDAIAPSDLSFSIEQTLTTGAGSFDQYKPIFVAHGFDLNDADVSKKGADYVNVENVTAGYAFAYLKSVYGTAKLEERKNDSGKTTEYIYTFSKLPTALLVIRTPEAQDIYPANIAALRALAAQNGWTTGQNWNDTFYVPDFGKIEMAAYEAVGDGLRRLISETGSPFLPTAYSVVPDGITIPAPAVGASPYTLPPISILTYKPGGTPPGGL